MVGLDLASTTDIASIAKIFKRSIDGVEHFYVITRNYVPESAAQKPENVHYLGWVKSGHLIETGGNMIDLEFIQSELLEDTHVVNVREIAKDPWGGQQLGANLANQGIEIVDIPMQTRYLSEPMKFIAALIDADPPRFHHDGNPAFIWMMSNVEVKPDHNENIFPRKQAAQNKIDAAIALIVAMSRAMVEGNSKYTVIDENYELMVI